VLTLALFPILPLHPRGGAAAHEAGHALAAWRYAFPLESVSIRPADSHVLYRADRPPELPGRVAPEAVIALAGGEAEIRLRGRADEASCAGDRDFAATLACRLCPDDRYARRLLWRSERAARRLVQGPARWHCIWRLAEHLLDDGGEIDGLEAEWVLDEALAGWRVRRR
jgi:hypothetical protein